MTHRLTRTIATLTVTAGLALAGVAPASAQQLSVRDARGDLVSFQGESQTATPAPRVRNHDVVRTTFAHSDRRVRVRVKYAELCARARAARTSCS